MISLLLSGNFLDQYFMLIILGVLIVAFMIFAFFRRKKEDTYYNDLMSRIVPGAHVKTRSGIYGKVISITETTDGKIVLLETGEGNKVSYQQIHVNAIFALDDKKPVVIGADGGILLPEEIAEKEKAEAEAKAAAKTEKKPAAKKTTTKKN